MKKLISKAGLSPIKFDFDTFFTVTFRRPKTVEKTVEKILDAIRNNPKITQNELMEVTDLTRRGIEWNLAKLKEKKIIKRIGPTKGGYWEVIELVQPSRDIYTEKNNLYIAKYFIFIYYKIICSK